MARLGSVTWLCAALALSAVSCEHAPDVVALVADEAPPAGGGAGDAAAAAAGMGASNAGGAGGTTGMAGTEVAPPVAPMCPFHELYGDALRISEEYDCRFEAALFPRFVAALDGFIASLPKPMGETAMFGSCEFAGIPYFRDNSDDRFIILCPTTCALMRVWIRNEQRRQVDCMAKLSSG